MRLKLNLNVDQEVGRRVRGSDDLESRGQHFQVMRMILDPGHKADEREPCNKDSWRLLS